MRIRNLVPVLACLAAAPAFIGAADTTPVKLDGFVDTIYGWSDNKSDDHGAGFDRVGSGFQYFAKLGAEITISDKVGGQVDITNDHNAYATSSTTPASNAVWIRQAYGTWKMTPELTFKSGEFINCIGWTAAYAPGLYRINAGPITSLYGDFSTVGADVTWAKDGTPVTLEAALTNGFFAEGTGETSQVAGTNYGYALYLDATYALPGKKGSVDAEFVYDAEASGARGGAGYHLGLNGTLTPTDEITAGAEVIYQKIGTPDSAPATEADQKNLGLMALANYKLPKNAWNASVTGQVSYVKKTNYDGVAGVGLVDGASAKVTEVALALLTTPAGTDKLGVNAEISFAKNKYDDGAGTPASQVTDKIWTISLEALYIIP